MKRRDLLWAAPAALGWGCAARRMPVAAPRDPHRPRPVLAWAAREIRTVVGLRPYRPEGYRIAGERVGEKTVIHHYGHGGCGMTLSWGTAHFAAAEALAAGGGRFAVLGCGGVGLATARTLQQRGGEVTIYTKALPPETTSNISGAQWWPTSLFDEDRLTPAFRDHFLQSAKISYRLFQNMVGADYGIRWVPNYFLRDEPFGDSLLNGVSSPLRELMVGFEDLPAGSHPFPAKFVRRWYTMMIEPPVYLNAMMRDFRLAGGRIVTREMRGLEELAALAEPVVVNCTGLGARALFGDNELTPIKGQLTFVLPQEEIDYNLIYSPGYMFPRRDGILLGGTHERGEWSLEPNLEAKARILAHHERVFAGFRAVGRR